MKWTRRLSGTNAATMMNAERVESRCKELSRTMEQLMYGVGLVLIVFVSLSWFVYSTFLLKLHPSVNRAFPPVG